MTVLLNSSPVWPELFLGLGLLLLLVVAVQVFRLVAAAFVLWMEWRRQRATTLWLRCDVVLRSLATRMRMSPPRLIVAGQRGSGSFGLGPFRSYIVVSRTLVSALDDEEMEAMLAHELGHIKRNDTVLGAAAGMCHCLLTFSPFARSAYGRYAIAREQAVDDLAVRSSGRPLALASCLVKSFRLLRNERPCALSNGLLPSHGALEGRIMRLIDWRIGAEPARSYWCVFSGVVAGVVAISLLTL